MRLGFTHRSGAQGDQAEDEILVHCGSEAGEGLCSSKIQTEMGDVPVDEQLLYTG